MKPARSKSTAQVRAIFGEARRCGLDSDALHELVAGLVPGTGSIKSLTFTQAEAVIEKLKGSSFVPRRTLQWRRKKSGVTQVVQKSQLQLIAELASQRNWSSETTVNFCRRQAGHYPLRTTQDANKVIEALKAMNKRDNLWAAA